MILIKRSLFYLWTIGALFSSFVYGETERIKSQIEGVWLESNKQKMAVWIEQCEQELCGYIYWLKSPYDDDGLPKLDSKNPDSTLQNRSQCGLKILSGFSSRSKTSWSGGQVYNPKDGKTFNGSIRLTDEGDLKVRGYVGISLFGKTLTWQRPSQELEPCG